MTDPKAAGVFATCTAAIDSGELIHRASSRDKEFHFQDWFQERLKSAGLLFEAGGRNSYPDFRLVEHTEGFEVKGLAWPGREANYDCNSQIPTGLHNGRAIYYVFGRYPAHPDDDAYPVVDLVVCDGDFLNSDHEYNHKNKSFWGFGSYGDIMIRDRKMYVAPTPFALTAGTTGQKTLIVREDISLPDDEFEKVGELTRVETDRLIVAYSFDLTTNELTPSYSPNPTAGREHAFAAYRVAGASGPAVAMKEPDDA